MNEIDYQQWYHEAEQANARNLAIETVVKNTIDELAFSEDEDCPW